MIHRIRLGLTSRLFSFCQLITVNKNASGFLNSIKDQKSVNATVDNFPYKIFAIKFCFLQINLSLYLEWLYNS